MTQTTFDVSQTPLASIGYQNIPNILDNGGMEIWQRGTTFNSVINGAYTIDRWSADVAGGNVLNITKETVNIDSGLASLSFNVSSAPSTTSSLDVAQTIENGLALYTGKTLSLSVRVKSNAAFQVGIKDGLTGSPGVSLATHSGNNQWQTLTVTRTIQSGPANNVTIFLGFMASYGGSTPVVSQTYIDSAMLVIGSTPISFVPTNPQVDLARCQRYYEISGGPAVGYVVNLGIARETNTSNAMVDIIRYHVSKRVAPTLTGTIVSIQLEGSPTIGNLAQADTGNWNIGFGVGNTEQVYVGLTRTSAQTLSNLAQTSYSWTASADL